MNKAGSPGGRPGDDIERILEVVKRHGLTVKAIVITHAHIDHIGGAQKLKQATGAPVYMKPDDEELQEMMTCRRAGWGCVRRSRWKSTRRPKT